MVASEATTDCRPVSIAGKDVPQPDFSSLSHEIGHPVDSVDFARALDQRDSLRHLRHEFYIPKVKDVAPEGKGVSRPRIQAFKG